MFQKNRDVLIRDCADGCNFKTKLKYFLFLKS